MGSLMDNLQKSRLLPRKPYKDDLPVSHGQQKADTHLIGLRKRISSFSVKIQPLSAASAEWAFRRSKSVPSFGGAFAGDGPLRRWWDSSWSWVLSRKPVFAQDIEMNEEETAALGWHSRGTLLHIFYRLRSEIRKLVGGYSNYTLPTKQQFQYDSFSYAQNFDYGSRAAEH